MLIKCRDCGNSVSEHANVCPSCGCPVEMSLNRNPFEELIESLESSGKRVFCSNCGTYLTYISYGPSALAACTLTCPDCQKKARITWDDYGRFTVTPIDE